MQTDDTGIAADVPVLELTEPLLGFPGRRHYTLIRIDDEGLVCELRSLDEPDLRFVVVPPAAFFSDYAPRIDTASAEAIGATSADDVLVLVLVNTTDSIESATANLLAPVVINHRTRRAVQVVLSDDSLSLRAPLSRATAADERSGQRVR